MDIWQQVTCPQCGDESLRREAEMVAQNHVLRCGCGHTFLAFQGVQMLRLDTDGRAAQVVPVDQWHIHRARGEWEGIYE